MCSTLPTLSTPIDITVVDIRLYSICALHCLIQFKAGHRAHIPICTCRSAPSATSVTFMRLPLFICIGYVPAWIDFDTLSQILDIILKPDPLFALFGFSQEEMRLGTEKRHALFFASPFALRAILVKRKDSAPNPHALLNLLSTFSHFTQRLSRHFTPYFFSIIFANSI